MLEGVKEALDVKYKLIIKSSCSFRKMTEPEQKFGLSYSIYCCLSFETNANRKFSVAAQIIAFLIIVF